MKVTGYLEWSVWVTCPHCNEQVSLVNLEPEIDYGLSINIFQNNWNNLEIEYRCPKCGNYFELENVEY